jgi:hypothetical protein
LDNLFSLIGIEAWKPVLTALLLPPVPMLLLMLLGAALVRRRALWGWLLLLAGAAGIWLSSTTAVGQWLQHQLLYPSHALNLQDLQQLRTPRRAVGPPTSAIVVLGSAAATGEFAVNVAAQYGAAGLGGQRVVGMHLPHQAVLLRVAGRDPLSQHHHRARTHVADDPGQEPGASAVGHQTDPGEDCDPVSA